MKNKNLSWVGALFVFALLLWCTAVTPGKVTDPATYTCAVYSTFFSLLPPRYFVEIMRAVYLKGSLIGDLWSDYVLLAVFAAAFNTLAAATYRKRA